MCCGITGRVRGSWDIWMDLPYPGTADCCFAQEPAEEQGVSGTLQRHPSEAGGGNPPSCSPQNHFPQLWVWMG